MEKRIRKYSLIILACLLSLPVLLRADDHLQTAQKIITKKIAIAKEVQLSISNQYGNIMIQHWKQKSAMLRVTITGQSPKLSRANALIRFVEIKNSNTPGVVSLETVIDTLSQHINPSAGEECHISYMVFVPQGLKLSVTNRFGNIHVKSFEGDLTIDEKFGNLKVEHTSGLINFDVEQGNADIDRLRGGVLKFKGFDSVRIGELSGIVDAKFWSGGKVDLGLSDDLQKLSINAANVKPLNVTNLKLANAELKIHSMVSKIIYNGHMLVSLTKPLNVTFKKPVNVTFKKPLPTDTVFIIGKGDTTKKPREKMLDLKKISITAMKSVDYTLKTGTATTQINLDASFCVLNIKD